MVWVDRAVAVLFVLYAMAVAAAPLDGQVHALVAPLDPYPGRIVAGAWAKPLFLAYLTVMAPVAMRAARRVPPVLAVLLAMGLLTVLWSPDPRRSLELLADLVLCLLMSGVLVQRLGFGPALRLVAMVAAGVLGLSVVLALLESPYARMGGYHEGLWRGLFSHKNQFAPFVLCVLWITWMPGAVPLAALRWGLRAMAVLALGMSGSATGVLALAASVGVFGARVALMQTALVPRLQGVVMVWLGLVAALLLVPLVPEMLDAMARDATFSGRSALWTAALAEVAEAPFGKGYGLSGGSDVLWEIRRASGWLVAPNMHNAFLTLAIDMGWLAAVLYLGWLVSLILPRATARPEAPVIAALGMALLVVAMTESAAGMSLHYPLFLILLVSAASLPAPLHRVSSPSQRQWELQTPRMA